jgi:serine/threonine protein kinase
MSVDLSHKYILSPTLIGSGETSKVYSGSDRKTGSPVSFKVCRLLDDADDFLEEAETLRKLIGAPHILQFRDSLHLHCHRPVIATTFDHSVNLSQFMSERKTELPTEHILSYVFQALEALCHLKQKEIIHADVKLDNFIIHRKSNSLTLIDFGLARTLEEHFNNDECTTPLYQPPEAYLGRGKTDMSYDMWSLGVLFFVLYTKEFPFPGEDDISLPLKYMLRNLGVPPADYLEGLGLNDQEAIRSCSKKVTFNRNWQAVIRKTGEMRKDLPEKVEQMVQFLEKIFKYEDRIKVEDALKDPLFSEEIHIKLDCEGVSRDEQKKTILKVQGYEIPLTARCVHFQKSSDGRYEMSLCSTDQKTIATFTKTLQGGDVLHIREEIGEKFPGSQVRAF